MRKLTSRQKETLDVIEKYIKLHKYPPTVKELGHLLGVASSSTSYALLVQLEKKGYVIREVNKPRALRVIRSADQPHNSY